ncbi:hypothetical protein RJT34_20324 [Clitoria ternatea]|uniref:Uncharacterized protein n=1 Tax=Clitoria ternatea TaxID=43366 RepID=A0AAN9IT97_CLITE
MGFGYERRERGREREREIYRAFCNTIYDRIKSLSLFSPSISHSSLIFAVIVHCSLFDLREQYKSVRIDKTQLHSLLVLIMGLLGFVCMLGLVVKID